MEKIRVDFLFLLSFYLWTFSFILPILCKEAMWRHLHTVLFFAWKSPFWRPIGKYYIISKKQKLCNTITYYHFLNVVLFLYFYQSHNKRSIDRTFLDHFHTHFLWNWWSLILAKGHFFISTRLILEQKSSSSCFS